ncbi:glycosyl hydrolase 115 family protein [Flavilitoribacter nigricans]|uniref:Glycosyl hydrolase n=1 Tax=Flavilitoribacter nigricans (strain ATCC 23147 / DSM 23189 / NBRC 102662 / NCIMB 1420 / SS-2) TaxID=1122177 RepID=A0A2D0MZB8_FLAN2|nr:glycosyl hydrolase 115 family protein [Flavilitoribacter nigricans]PHN01624.1 glycosyl hydrolase [Flavilitoribacter nigricans DSM 23189 = NBRC 102662]
MYFTRTSYTLALGYLFCLLACGTTSRSPLETSADLPTELNVRTATSYLSFNPDDASLPIFRDGQAAPILIDESDFPGVARVAGHLAADLEMTTGRLPETLSHSTEQTIPLAIIVGTLGKSRLIDQLAAAGKIPAAALQGRWEKFYLTTVDKPFENIERALVIAGSDKRGTIYGMFDLSEKMGVSPWNWWADVPVERQSFLGIRPGLYTDGEPKVKYRGIFINDEAPALSGWVHENYGKFNHEFYGKVFELILRMKGNYLWPAMWGRAIYDDDPRSPELADEYGVVLGTSHHEPLMRAHVEWDRYGEGAWNYNTNPTVLQDFWRKGIQRMGDNESIVSIGMRGDGDEPMSEESNIALLEKIVRDQREIIAAETGKAVEQTPQMWALYKEVQEYYDKGMRVPDDVTLLLCDDNWGNIRKLPPPDAPARSGGYGIYYHYDYVGGPRNYKWINTNNIARVWEQMQMAYEHQVRQVWIVNVGDIKPMELPTQFFLDLAWDPEQLDHEQMTRYTRQWAHQQFNDFRTGEIAYLLDQYSKFNSRRKPELLNLPTYSLTQYDEAAGIVADYKALEARARSILNDIPVAYHDAFYQLVYFPIAASANLNELYFSRNVNQWYAAQGRVATNRWAEKVKACFTRDSLLTYYHNHLLADGKWNHLMDQTHIGYTYWQQPPNNNMPELTYLQPEDRGRLGVWLPGQDREVQEKEFNTLPTLYPQLQETTFLKLFNTGKTPLSYQISSNQDWVKPEVTSGLITTEQRIGIGIDWEQLPPEASDAQLTVSSPGQDPRTIHLYVNRNNIPHQSSLYVEQNDVVSIKAESGYIAHNGAGIEWRTIRNYGRTGDGIKAFPSTVTIAPDQLSEDTPHLTYDFHLASGGDFDIKLLLGPTIDFYDKGGLLTAISIDGQTPRVLNIHDPEQYRWDRSVSRNVNEVTTRSFIPPGKHQLKIWHLDPGIVFEKIVLSRSGKKDNTFLGPPPTFKR